MNVEKICLLVRTCISYGHLGYLNLENQELICLYNECLAISDHFGDIFCGAQLSMLLGELQGKNCFEECSKYLKMSKVSERKGNEMEANVYLLMARKYGMLYKLQKAIECCKKAIDISKHLGISAIEGRAYWDLGNLYVKLNYFRNEIKECAENCLQIGNKLEDKKLEGCGYFLLGSAYLGQGKWNEGICYTKKSQEIASQLNDKHLLGVAYSNIGICYDNLGDLKQAIYNFRMGLAIVKETGDRAGESTIYASMGKVYLASGYSEQAMNCYLKSLNISIAIGNKNGEAASYLDLGGLYWAQSKYHKSMECFEKGLKVFKDIKSRVGEGAAYLHFSGVYFSVGKTQESLVELKKSLAIAIETGDKKRQMNCYGNLGVIYQKSKKYVLAIKYHKDCRDCAIEIGDKMGEGSANCYIGGVYLNLEQPKEALGYFETSLNIATSFKDKRGEAYAYYYLGKAYFYLDSFDEAITYLEKSLNIAMEIGNKRIAGWANTDLGMIYYHLMTSEEKSEDAKEKAEEKLKKAVECCEWQFSHLRDLNDFKISIVDTYINTYELLSKVLIERGKIEEALLISDRGRARSLGDILASKYGITEARYPSQKPLESNDLESVLSSNQFCILFFAIGHAWALTHQRPIVCVNIDSQALTAVKELQLEKEVETRKCENRSLESAEEIEFPKVSEIQAKKSPIQSVERYVVPVGEPQMEVNEEKKDQLEVLFSLLITPVIQHLQHEEIVIIPDGPLYRVPFAALKDPVTKKFLSETKSIRFSPSLATLKGLRECTVDFHSKTGALIVGDPDVGDVVLRGEETFLTRLPSAGHEAKIIGQLLGAEPLIASQATKEMVKQKMKEGVAVIHIAAHGDSDHGHIALAPSPRTNATSIPGEEDYMLTMQEVQEIGVTAKLVVLSCCHSGSGDIKAEGVVGMSRAFLAAGARAVVASLWAIDDEATLNFMISFYTFLKMGKSASKSLRMAINDIRGQEDFEDPKYWAPFFLIGDDVTISV